MSSQKLEMTRHIVSDLGRHLERALRMGNQKPNSEFFERFYMQLRELRNVLGEE